MEARDAVTAVATGADAPAKRGWGKLILALVAFVLVPSIPPLRASLPIEHTITLLVPALAACTLVGWWSGGRAALAVAWVAIAALLASQQTPPGDGFFNLARGWSLLLAGSFGLVCLFGSRGAFFPRALTALGLALGLAAILSSLGPVSTSEARTTVQSELSRRNEETMSLVNDFIGEHATQWQEFVARVPQMNDYPAAFEKSLQVASEQGLSVFPALLALESLAALALAWATYHRIGRARLGSPLGRLRDFRFNDQLVWGLIVGFIIVFLPTLGAFRGLGRNLLVFLGALYAVRGLGVLAWFISPGMIMQTALVAFAVILWPLAQAMVPYAAIATFGLGLGDTWADWRKPRARPTS